MSQYLKDQAHEQAVVDRHVIEKRIRFSLKSGYASTQCGAAKNKRPRILLHPMMSNKANIIVAWAQALGCSIADTLFLRSTNESWRVFGGTAC